MASYRETEARRAAKWGRVSALIGAAGLALCVWGVWRVVTRAEVRRPPEVGRTYRSPPPTPEQTRRWERDKAHRPTAPTRTPTSVARGLLREEEATARWVGQTIEVTYHAECVLTHGTMKLSYLVDVKRLVPALLARFPAAQGVRVTATATFTSARGHKHRDTAFSIGFSRRNAASIDWGNVLTKNVPLLAEEFFQDPVIDAE